MPRIGSSAVAQQEVARRLASDTSDEKYDHEHVTTFLGTLDTYSLERSGETYKLAFTVPKQWAGEIIKLNDIKQRLCAITVSRMQRKKAKEVEMPGSFAGVDDGDD